MSSILDGIVILHELTYFHQDFHSIRVGKTERNQGYLISVPKSLPEDEQQKVVELEHEDRLAAADKTLHLIHHYQITMSNLSI